MIAKFLAALVFACFLATAAFAQSITTGDNWTKYHYKDKWEFGWHYFAESTRARGEATIVLTTPAEVFVSINVSGESKPFLDAPKPLDPPDGMLYTEDFLGPYSFQRRVGFISYLGTYDGIDHGGDLLYFDNTQWQRRQEFPNRSDVFKLVAERPSNFKTSFVANQPGEYTVYVEGYTRYFPEIELELTVMNR